MRRAAWSMLLVISLEPAWTLLNKLMSGWRPNQSRAAPQSLASVHGPLLQSMQPLSSIRECGLDRMLGVHAMGWFDGHHSIKTTEQHTTNAQVRRLFRERWALGDVDVGVWPGYKSSTSRQPSTKKGLSSRPNKTLTLRNTHTALLELYSRSNS